MREERKKDKVMKKFRSFHIATSLIEFKNAYSLIVVLIR